MKILLQFEEGPNTRWLFPSGDVRKAVESLGRNIAHALTDGSVPKVSAIIEESKVPEVICAWCSPGVTRPGISHGICTFHKEAMLKQKTEQPKETTCDLQP